MPVLLLTAYRTHYVAKAGLRIFFQAPKVGIIGMIHHVQLAVSFKLLLQLLTRGRLRGEIL